MSELLKELRAKYKTPAEAMRALGLDENLLRREKTMADQKPTRLEYLLVTRTAAACNPLLAMDKTVDYGPVFAGVTTKNLPSRKDKIITDLKATLKGNTIAQDADVSNVSSLLNRVDHPQGSEPEESLDESVSGPQHRAMMAAAEGKSNLDIPKSVGEEFKEADKGKTFNDADPTGGNLGSWLQGKDAAEIDKMKGGLADWMKQNGAGDADIRAAHDWMFKKTVGGDTENEVTRQVDQHEKAVGDEKTENEREDREAGKKPAADKTIGKDEMKEIVQAAIDVERANSRAAAEAREFVRPWTGELPIALDSAEAVFRKAASMLGVRGADKINVDGLREIISRTTKPGARPVVERKDALAQDAAKAKSFAERFPDASRIGIGA